MTMNNEKITPIAETGEVADENLTDVAGGNAGRRPTSYNYVCTSCQTPLTYKVSNVETCWKCGGRLMLQPDRYGR